jgi:hypothetical protein
MKEALVEKRATQSNWLRKWQGFNGRNDFPSQTKFMMIFATRGCFAYSRMAVIISRSFSNLPLYTSSPVLGCSATGNGGTRNSTSNLLH